VYYNLQLTFASPFFRLLALSFDLLDLAYFSYRVYGQVKNILKEAKDIFIGSYISAEHDIRLCQYLYIIPHIQVSRKADHAVIIMDKNKSRNS